MRSLHLSYNRFAGESHERLSGLSDGVFAVAMTLLVLELHVPGVDGIVTEGDLWAALGDSLPYFGAYFLSFLTLGIFWLGQQVQLSRLARSDRNLVWIHLGFLLAVTVIPFSTKLLAEFSGFRIALVVYWLNILLLGLLLFVSWRYAVGLKLVKDEVTEEVTRGIERRIFLGQSLYLFGMLLGVFVTPTIWGIAVIVLVQLNYSIGPLIYGLFRREAPEG